MSWNTALNFRNRSMSRMESGAPGKTPLIGSVLLGFVGSLCCGGGLIFGAIGLGAVYGSLGIARYIPEALAASAVLIMLLNWLYYRRNAAKMCATAGDCDCASVRRMALKSTFLGLSMMAMSFLLLEWLNHGVVHAVHFMHNPEFASSLIPGVPNSHLGYLVLTFLVLPVLWLLPFPSKPRQEA